MKMCMGIAAVFILIFGFSTVNGFENPPTLPEETIEGLKQIIMEKEDENRVLERRMTIMEEERREYEQQITQMKEDMEQQAKIIEMQGKYISLFRPLLNSNPNMTDISCGCLPMATPPTTLKPSRIDYQCEGQWNRSYSLECDRGVCGTNQFPSCDEPVLWENVDVSYEDCKQVSLNGTSHLCGQGWRHEKKTSGAIGAGLLTELVKTSCNDCGDISTALDWQPWGPCSDGEGNMDRPGRICRRRGNTKIGFQEEEAADKCESLTRKMKSLAAVADDPLNSICSKQKRVKHGVWSCSEEENIGFLRCDVGYKINTFECIDPNPSQQLVVTGGWDDGGNRLATSELMSADGVLCNHKIPNLPVAVHGASSVYFNNHLLVCGGYSDSGYQDSCHQLGSSTSTWTPADSLKIKRRYFSLTKVDEELYAVGGEGSGGGELDSIEKLVAGKWQLLSQTMETPRSRHCTVYMASKKSLIIIGGGYPYTNEVKSLDINSLEWTTLDPLPVSSLFGHSCQLIQENGEDTIYVTGGYIGGVVQSKVWKYKRGSWSSAGGQLKQARYSHSMGVRNGTLLVVGGSDGSGELASLEQMDSIGNWETMPTKLAMARSYHSIAAVPVESFKCLP